VEKPKRASLQGGTTEASVTLPEALKLLSLPRIVGQHPDDNEPITTNFGRFGPYVKHGDEFRSLDSEDDVFNISFEAALALVRAPKVSRRRQSSAKTVLRELTQNGTTFKLLSGRYGPYVTDGTTHATLPKSADPTAVTLDEAIALIDAKAAKGPSKKGGRKPAAKKKAPARKKAKA
jgi:DNA topoisomerase-1